jgi:predicted DNA-binding transcriptional regulator YafY
VRLAQIVAHLLRERRATRADLEARFGVNRRQMLDDLAALQRVGFVRRAGTGKGTAYEVDAGLLQRALPPGDQLALLVGAEVTRFLEGTPLSIPGGPPSPLAEVVRCVAEPSRTYAPRAELVRTCLDAVTGRRRLRVAYDGPRGNTTFDGYEPTNLLVYKRALYLLGRIGGSRKPYPLALDRISRAEPGEPFEPPAGWDVDAWLADRFGLTADEHRDAPEEIVLRFAADVALYVRERTFHPTQRLEEIRDGQLRLRMRAMGRELVPFVLQWGPKVVVEGPDWLRDAVRTELEEALRGYP